MAADSRRKKIRSTTSPTACTFPPSCRSEWIDVFDRFLGPDWRHRLRDPANWRAIDGLPDDALLVGASVPQVADAADAAATAARAAFRATTAARRTSIGCCSIADPVNPNVLTIGFGRRFATYKRATLLFENLNWLERLLSDAERPVLFVFAGRAHPADVPGQDLIRTIARFARLPFLEGKVLLVEGYDLQLARRLVVRRRRMAEQSRASAGGVRHLGHEGGHERRHQPVGARWLVGGRLRRQQRLGDQARGADARSGAPRSRGIANALRNPAGPGDPDVLRSRWQPAIRRSGSVLPSARSRASCRATTRRAWSASTCPNSTAPPQITAADTAMSSYAAAKVVAAWKARVRAGVAGRRFAPAWTCRKTRLKFGQEHAARGRRDAQRPRAGRRRRSSCCLASLNTNRSEQKPRQYRFAAVGAVDSGGKQRYVLDLAPEVCGRLDYRIRAYPWHELLAHPFELGAHDLELGSAWPPISNSMPWVAIRQQEKHAHRNRACSPRTTSTFSARARTDGSIRRMGCHLVGNAGAGASASGASFAVWAPNAARISVVGEFNGWESAAHPMQARADGSGVWERFVPGVERGQTYKYRVDFRACRIARSTKPIPTHSSPKSRPRPARGSGRSTTIGKTARG